ncbi:uncharacterized protein LOC141678753 [Apium graveolens]|uniref:uncharacterized protein LOC141678753 n=1 Tax=Apium graveolens TaxID=4045 RepID=UPI003D7A8FE7
MMRSSSSSSSRMSEIEIEQEEWYRSEELFEIKHLESIYEETGKEDEQVVYVALLGQTTSSNSSSSSHDMDALVWTLNHLLHPFSESLVNLVYVFPQLHYIPTPLGKLPINQVNPEQKERYMIQERGKRRDFLQKFLDICAASKVKVETILIESDMEAKALLDLIPILYMKKLVLGAPKSSLRKLRSRKGNETVDQMVQNMPEFCELHIICEGKEVMLEKQTLESPSSGVPDNINNIVDNNNSSNDISENCREDEFQNNASFPCSCFTPKARA